MSRPWIHQTDLFRPHFDPDDHWDLATVFALTGRGRVDLRGVLIDYPLPGKDPDVQAVAQLNRLHGLGAPVVVGSAVSTGTAGDPDPRAVRSEHGGVEFVLRTLRESSEPVVIHIVGSCRDVALAGGLDPALFREKCAAVYLNAGNGGRTPGTGDAEWNVALDPASYAAIFDLPCLIYWLPCFGDRIESVVQEWGTFWQFRQDEMLGDLSPRMRNYFAYVLGRIERSDWLRFLESAPDEADAILSARGADAREMWSTAGFLHAAGYSVSTAGELVEIDASHDPVYEFVAATVAVDDRGRTSWSEAPDSTDRWIFHVRNREMYQPAMTAALRELLASAP